MEQYIRLFKSFTYAFAGIFRTIRNERNLRIHITCLTYMFSILCFTDWFELTKPELALLVLTSGSVISSEIVNTAIENAVNLASEKYTEFGKISKDAAAGAVLINVIFAVIVGIIILFQPAAFVSMYKYFATNPLMLILFVSSIIPSSIFIFWGNPFKKRS